MSIEAMKQALEALEEWEKPMSKGSLEAHRILRTAIEQAEKQEPVADGLIRRYINALVANKPDEAADATKRMVDYVFATPPEAQPAPVQDPVLQEIEQYRLQMAGISTAAIGYWKEGDGIHPDYDTPALRDVAKLYAKYDALYTAAQRQPLTDEQIELGRRVLSCFDLDLFMAGARFAEAAHGIKEKNT